MSFYIISITQVNLLITFLCISIVLFNYGYVKSNLLTFLILFNYLIINYLLLILLFLYAFILFGSKIRFQNPNLNFIVLFLLFFSFFWAISLQLVKSCLMLYIVLEGLSFCIYFLMSLDWTSNISIEAGLKYFIFGVVSTLIFLFGILLIYRTFGSLDFQEIMLLVLSSSEFSFKFFYFLNLQFIIGFTLILSVLLFKLGAFPFCIWIPDIYDGSSFLMTFFLMTVPKVAIFGLLCNICFYFFFNFILFDYLKLVLFYSGLFSILFGCFGGIIQRKLKRILAYGSINHTGFLLISLSFFNELGFEVCFFYLFVYLILISVFFVFFYNFNNYFNFKRIRFLWQLKSLFNSNPFFIYLFIFLLASFSGLPPFVGFIIKLFVFKVLVLHGYYFTTVFLMFLSLLSVFYYIKLIRDLIFTQQNYNIHFSNKLPFFPSFILSSFSVFNVVFFFFPNLLFI